ncbi:MAG TPA: DUF4142 domain-containing protein [Gaiellaceae bacterium]|nr:DUF4142 domain-containing protein [Gaiellaceae bacterium]
MKKALLGAAVVCAAVALPAQAAAPTSAWDKEWLKTDISGDHFEISGGKMALKKTHNAAVLALAHRLVSDHSKSLQEAVKLAHSLGIKPPDGPTPSMTWELKMVGSLSAGQFDYWYSNLEVYDHSQDISEAKSEASEGTNTQVRKQAQTEIPMLRLHYDLARRALAASKP